MTPVRIQRRRTKGWRLPDGAIYVGRPTRWGSPYRLGDYAFLDGDHEYPRATTDELSFESGALARQAGVLIERITDVAKTVRWYRAWFLAEQADRPYYGIADLRGHDLACWCPEPCGEPVALFGVAYGDQYEPCAKPRGHVGYHLPSVAPWCHADVLLELANLSSVDYPHEGASPNGGSEHLECGARGRSMSIFERPKCSIPDCGRSAATDHLWCHAHVLVHAASVRGGYLSLDQARQMVRAGARAEDVMADENDWVVS